MFIISSPIFSLLLLCSVLLYLPLSIIVYNVVKENSVSSSSSAADAALFEAAAKTSVSVFAPKKVAFMFLTTTPLPFAPLWELYFNKAPKSLYTIYVHADPTRTYDPPFSGVFSGRTIRSEPTRRQTPTLAAAARRLLATALLDDPSNAMFALISPSCVPIRSFAFAYKTLVEEANPAVSFVEILGREKFHHGRWAARGPATMLPEVSLRDFRIGSQFWVLTRRHAGLVVRDHELWPKFGLPCVDRETCYPEENYFPTLLSMRDLRGCVPATLTHVRWAGGRHPRKYSSFEVVSELIFELRRTRPRYGDCDVRDWSNGSHPFLFARKFAPGALGPLMDLAQDVIFKD